MPSFDQQLNNSRLRDLAHERNWNEIHVTNGDCVPPCTDTDNQKLRRSEEGDQRVHLKHHWLHGSIRMLQKLRSAFTAAKPLPRVLLSFEMEFRTKL